MKKIVAYLLLLTFTLPVTNANFEETDWEIQNHIFPNNIGYQDYLTKKQFINAIVNFFYDTGINCDEICIAQKYNIISSNKNLDEPINTAVASKVILSALGIKMAEGEPWYTLWMEEANKFKGFKDLNKQANDNLTKYEATKILYQILRFRKPSSNYVKDINDFIISYIENIEANDFNNLVKNYWTQKTLINIKNQCAHDNNLNHLTLLDNGQLHKIWKECAYFNLYWVELVKVEPISDMSYKAVVAFYESKKGDRKKFYGNVEIIVNLTKDGYKTEDFLLAK